MRRCSTLTQSQQYLDPYYSGGEIGEFSFYNWKSNSYSSSYCKSGSCTPLNCHEADTEWELLGVFVEADGLEDFTEQLFKHQGVCLWADDTVYESMQGQREQWPTYCTALSTKMGGRQVYLDVKPQAFGNMTYGIYTDKYCQTESSYSWNDYLYKTYGNSYSGRSEVSGWNTVFENWNKYMNDYKGCVPCRSYQTNKYYQYYHESSGSPDHEEEGGGARRQLEHEDEGGGYNEINGYDCYDDAGYLNCNQCYKFQTKTDMYPASTDDLELASAQGTILSITVDGVTYGSGGFGNYAVADTYYDDYTTEDMSSDTSYAGAAGSAFVLTVLAYLGRHKLRKTCTRDRSISDSMKEAFEVDPDDDISQGVTEMTRR